MLPYNLLITERIFDSGIIFDFPKEKLFEYQIYVNWVPGSDLGNV
jgi:hypothetical protein